MVHPVLSKPIHWKENRIPVLVVENTKLFQKLVFELSAQKEGEEGDFVLSKNYECLEIPKHLFLVRDYVELSLEERRIQQHFQEMLLQVVCEDMPQEMQHINEEVNDYLSQVMMRIEYPVSFSQGDYGLQLLKMVKYHPALEGETLAERLLQYMEWVVELMVTPCFVFVSLKEYIDVSELPLFYQTVRNKKWNILLLEHHLEEKVEGEAICVIDEGLCELRLDEDGEFI